MRHPKYNKGLAFNEVERDRLHLRGLLPPAVLSQGTQAERAMINVRMKASDLERYSYLQGLQERNEGLFFKVVRDHIAELLHVVHLPTVRQACKKYGLMFKSLPRALFLTRRDAGDARRILKNWPERRIKVVMVTNGEQVGPAGDLGVHAVNAAIAKLALVTAVGGVAPALTMPILVDLGTHNDELLKSQFYSGVRHRRLTGDAADEVMHELLRAIERRFGSNTFLFFEDLSFSTTRRLLSQYSLRFPCFSDDFQGLSAAVLAALLGALPETGLALRDHRLLVVGAGPHRVAVAEMLTTALAADARGMAAAARARVYLADGAGLVTQTSPHAQDGGAGAGSGGSMADAEDEMRELLLYAKDLPNMTDLEAIVDAIKPTVLITCASSPRDMRPVGEPVVRALARHTPRPLILALSSPTPELSAAQAYNWSGGAAMYANFEGAQEEVTTPDGHILTPSKVQSVYIFPGLTLGTLVARAQRIKEAQILAAAQAVASMVSDEDRALGRVLPPLARLPAVARRVAIAVARGAYDANIATALPKPTSLERTVDQYVYDPSYMSFA